MKGAKRTLALFALAVLLVGSIAAMYVLIQHVAGAGPDYVANRLFLLVLSSGVVVLALGLAGVLIRNLVRLIMDRKRGILGSRLRTKLVFFFLALVLPPALVLFYGSAAVIKITVEAMLKTPVESVTRYAQETVDDWTDYLRDQCLRNADEIAGEIHRADLLRSDRRRALQSLLGRLREREDLQILLVTAGRDPLAVSSANPEGVDFEDSASTRAIEAGIEEVLEKGRATGGVDYLGRGLLVYAVVPVPEGETIAGTVASGIYLPPRSASRLGRISSAVQDYRQFRVQRRELVAFYLALIALIFLTTVFVAMWMGFYLARRITDPVQELAAASREISAGNLGVRVRSQVGDELGTLVEAFNEMAAQLQESKDVITRSTAELRRSNRALEERRNYIETLLANLSTGVVSLDGEGQVTTANPAVEGILGVKLSVGDDARARLSKKGLEPLADLLDQTNRQGSLDVRRDLSLGHEGETVSVSVQLSPLKGRSKEILGTLIMVEDLTDLLRAQKAAAWREVARRIAHEIKNPLTPIQLAAQRLRKKFSERPNDLEEVLPEATASIEREVGELKRLVDEFSKYARMPEVSPEPVDFRQVVESVLSLYRGHPGVHWEVETGPDVGNVRVDPEQMRRALINLIDNALTAMAGQGTIRIITRSDAGPGSLHIELSDTGPGVTAADRDKMFVPYFSTKRRGAGLGLAIVHRVVTDHRGSIRVEDNEPRGARFVIDIPA
jgi:two-component system nitrogen regulation sensor histidine kinase NtrY